MTGENEDMASGESEYDYDGEEEGKKRRGSIAASIISIAAIALSLMLSITLWQKRDVGVRRLFIFEKYDSGDKEKAAGQEGKGKKEQLAMEIRYLAKESVQGEIAAYADDLLLGNITHGLRPLFSAGTRAVSCFLRRGVLYLDLNGALLRVSNNSSDIETGVKLLKENILRNFTDVKEVCVFIEGTEAYNNKF